MEHWMTPRFPLSFLDLTPIESGSDAYQALGVSVELARIAEELGYTRIWYAEHHNTSGLASAAPEIMIAHIATQTDRIRLGSGGVMLPNHAPLKIIETFRLLEALHPGRIDLGLGRAPGTDTITAFAMRRSAEALTAEDYPQQLAELIAYDDEAFPAGHAFATIRAVPVDVRMPPLWLLGSSEFSGRLAAQRGLGFGFAAHISRALAIPTMRAYREQFVPSERYPAPHSILTVSVTIGDSAEHAADLSLVNELFLLRLRTGQLGRYPTLEEAKAYQFSDQERALIASMPLNFIAGTADQVHREVVDLAELCQADEVMITTTLPGAEDRRRTLTSMAEQFGLVGAARV
jgi:luciferase family oxidoreductase group 1